MVTKTKKPRKLPTKQTRSERVKQSLYDWHQATIGVLLGVREIVVSILTELENGRSPFHEFIRDPRDMVEFLNSLDNADSSLTFILPRESQPVSVAIPNPVDVLRMK